ncbi:hypothetical protein N7492_008969 [Penicillium capsulatum]|uniref:F-box domain-containing protein n=1 Tax=Penicillium capsulatum TaxID=69766 RepID=A0A9W9HRN5_9EURO|nr:hypothetical protein N7492_008969 [Penicillium capsulatum]KAJ6106370.1 hypothetical protein N7512_009887 [Penicillium capsulatum]
MGKKKARAGEAHGGDLDVKPVRKPLRAPRLAPFRFLDLPSEIRLNIYHFILFTPSRKGVLKTRGTLGASAKKSKAVAPASQRISLFLASHQVYNEASHYFYSTQIFRVFPVQDFSHLPTLRGLPPRHRSSLATIELVLGSSWTAPPPSWNVNHSLGLQDMTAMRTLKVFVGCDPSQPVFEGFRISKEFYTEFSGRLMREIIQRLPSLVWVEFDAYPSVSRKGSLMIRLIKEARQAGKEVHWGPQRGWTELDKAEDDEHLADQERSPVEDLRPLRPGPIETLTEDMHGIRLRA